MIARLGATGGTPLASWGHPNKLPRLLAVLALLILTAAPAVAPHAAAGEPSSVPFLQVRIERVTPEVVTHNQRARRHRRRNRAERR